MGRWLSRSYLRWRSTMKYKSSAENALLKYEQVQEEDAKLTREEKAQKLEKIQRNISFLHKLQKKYSQEPKSRQLEIQEKSEQEARELEEKKRKEEICLAIKESRKQLFQEAGGRLDDKSAEQVKGLIDSWRQEEKRWFLNQKDYSEFFGKTDFYKAFGQPDKKQLISNYYYFYYACKDGTVQLEIDADSLSEENIIRVSEMNIF